MGTSPMNDELNLSDVKEVDSSTFFTALKQAKTKNPFGAYVTLHDIADYNSCKGVFLLYDHTAGVAVEEDGNIISVFSDQTHRGVLPFLLAKAIEVGGCKLDCFGSEGLRFLYLRRGFIPISKTKFIREFAPDEWNYERDGEPDIIFWIYDKSRSSPLDDADIVFCDWSRIPSKESYDEAKKYRDELLKQQRKKHG